LKNNFTGDIMILEKERSKSLKQWRLKMQKIKRGKELNRILGLTARNIMIFGILSIVSILI